jgi:hypothetical protein
MSTGFLQGVKRPGRGADHPPLSSVVVEYGYSFTCTSSVCLLNMYGDSFYLLLVLSKLEHFAYKIHVGSYVSWNERAISLNTVNMSGSVVKTKKKLGF